MDYIKNEISLYDLEKKPVEIKYLKLPDKIHSTNNIYSRPSYNIK